MVRSRGFLLGVVAVLAMVVAAPVRAEEQENPEYKQWSKYKADTMVKSKTVTDAGGQKSEIEMTMTLKSVAPEKAVVEMKNVMSVGGQKMDLPAQSRDVPAKLSAPATATPQTTDAPKPETKSGDETIKVGDKDVKCKWTESTSKQGDSTTVSKTWTTDEIPGGMAKMEAKTTGADGKETMSMKTEVVEFSVK